MNKIKNKIINLKNIIRISQDNLKILLKYIKNKKKSLILI